MLRYNLQTKNQALTSDFDSQSIDILNSEWKGKAPTGKRNEITFVSGSVFKSQQPHSSIRHLHNLFSVQSLVEKEVDYDNKGDKRFSSWRVLQNVYDLTKNPIVSSVEQVEEPKDAEYTIKRGEEKK